MNKGFFGNAGGLPALVPGREVFQPADFVEGGYYDGAEPSQGLDFRSLWSAVYRNRYLILAVVVVSLLIGLAATLLMTPVYRAEASVQIEQQTRRVLGTEDRETDSSVQDADRFLETQLDVVRSRYLAERVGQDLRLFGNDVFLHAMNEEVPTRPEGALDLRATKREAVLEAITENTSVSLPLNSRIARIHFDSPDPVLAARVANSFVTNFITSNLQRKFDQSSYARDFLSNQLADTKQRLEKSERDMIAYARGARLIDTSSGVVNEQQISGPRSLTTSSLVQLNTALSSAMAQRVQAQQRWEQASNTSPMNLPEVLANKAIQDLVQQRAEQVALYEQERQRRREEFPSVQQAAARIAELDRQIATIAENIKAGIRQEYRVAQQQEQALTGNLTRLKGETLAEQDRSVRYNILKREADTNRQMYEGLLQRYRELSAEAGVTSNNVTILDKASIPVEPVSPRPVLNMGLAGVAGLGLALLLVFVRERFDDRIRSPEDVEGKLGVAPLGVIPMLEAGENPAGALAEPRSPMSEAYQTLRTSIELSSSEGLPRSLLFTSSQPNEGKSTSSFAVASDFARVGRRVLLIDADLRKPSMHRVLSLPNEVGLSNVLAGRSKVEDVVQDSGLPNLDFLATGPLPPNPAELLSSARLVDLLEKLESVYDLVVFDAPPVMGLADAPLLASRAGGIVFVVEANRSHHGSAKTALKRLLAAHARVLGVVLTKFDAKTTGYGEYYGYGYRYGSLPSSGAS
jgi:succinoglycan biosynthesis transport protein ExoP